MAHLVHGMLGGQALHLLRLHLMRNIQLHIQLRHKGGRDSAVETCPKSAVPADWMHHSLSCTSSRLSSIAKNKRAGMPQPAHPDTALEQLQRAAHEQRQAGIPLPGGVSCMPRLHFAGPDVLVQQGGSRGSGEFGAGVD